MTLPSHGGSFRKYPGEPPDCLTILNLSSSAGAVPDDVEAER